MHAHTQALHAGMEVESRGGVLGWDCEDPSEWGWGPSGEYGTHGIHIQACKEPAQAWAHMHALHKYPTGKGPFQGAAAAWWPCLAHGKTDHVHAMQSACNA